MSEFTEQFMIQGDGPVLAQELSYIRNQPSIIPLDDLIEVLNTQAHKRVQWRDDHFLATQIRHSLNNTIGVNVELDIVALKVVNVLRN